MIYKDLLKEHIPELAILYVDTFNSPPWDDEWSIESASNRLLQMINCGGLKKQVKLFYLLLVQMVRRAFIINENLRALATWL